MYIRIYQNIVKQLDYNNVFKKQLCHEAKKKKDVIELFFSQISKL